MGNIVTTVSAKIFNGNSRSRLAKKNILFSIVLKFVDAISDYLLVPISLAYLTQINYGVWLTISSLINWLNVFDVGISHGLRNKLTVSLSDKNDKLSKEYVSTAYVSILTISSFLMIISFIVVPNINWNYLLNVSTESNSTISYVVQMVSFTFCLTLILKILTSIFLAYQLPAFKFLMNSISKLFSLIVLSVFVYFLDISKDNLFFYSIIITTVPVLVLLFSNFYFFISKFKSIKPSFKFFKFDKVSEILGLGINFFIIQLSVTVLFLSDNLIISHVLGPQEVTPYQITGKYFNLVLVLFTLIITPFWSAITKAYNEGDINWIKRVIKKLHIVWFSIIVLSLLLSFLFYPILDFWIGSSVYIPVAIVIQWSIFCVLQCLNMIYTYFLNGVGYLKIQLIGAIFTLVLNVPLSYFFAKNFGLGSSGVLLATNLSILIYIISRKIQYHKVINNSAVGIWKS